MSKSLYAPQVIEIVTRKPKPGHKRAKIWKRICVVCGQEFMATQEHGKFCSDRHKVIFNNIRRTRGAQLYDFFMTIRYEREKAAALDAWSCICALAATFRDADAGKISWGDIREHLDKMPYLKKTADDIIDKRAARNKKGGE
jgi:predicted nucleic acid-binding Zn ribbon protein